MSVLHPNVSNGNISSQLVYSQIHEASTAELEAVVLCSQLAEEGAAHQHSETNAANEWHLHELAKATACRFDATMEGVQDRWTREIGHSRANHNHTCNETKSL